MPILPILALLKNRFGFLRKLCYCFDNTRLDLFGKNLFRDEIKTDGNNKVEKRKFDGFLQPVRRRNEFPRLRPSNRFPDRPQVRARFHVSPPRQ